MAAGGQCSGQTFSNQFGNAGTVRPVDQKGPHHRAAPRSIGADQRGEGGIALADPAIRVDHGYRQAEGIQWKGRLPRRYPVMISQNVWHAFPRGQAQAFFILQA